MQGIELYEVIYALRVARWGKGLASEASTHLISEVFRLKDPDIESIFALVYPQNIRSVEVLERLGMTFLRKRLDVVSQRYASLYGVARSTFLHLHHAQCAPTA